MHTGDTAVPSPSPPAKNPDHELRLLFVNGSSGRFVTGELVRLILRRDSYLAVLALALLVAFVSPPLLRGGLPPLAYALTTVVQFLMFPPVFLGTLLVANILCHSLGRSMVFEPAVTVITTVLVGMAGLAVAIVLLGEVVITRAGLLASIALQIVLWECLVLLVLLFVVPAMQRRKATLAPSPPPSPVPETGFRLGKVSLDPGTIRRIDTDDHYLILHVGHEQIRVLARMAQIVPQLADRGMMVHRSHWVAFVEFGPVTRNGRAFQMVTRSGGVVPVSREKWRSVAESAARRDALEGEKT